MRLHSADKKLRMENLESLSSGSHYQLSRYKFCVVQRHAEKCKAVVSAVFINETKLEQDNNCDISKHKLHLAVQHRFDWSKRGHREK